VSVPRFGAVLGIDVGFSQKRPSSAVCRLEWTESQVKWQIRHFRAVEPERTDAVTSIAGAGQLMAAAFDGPIRRDLDDIGAYRAAEQILTRKLQRIGKPGQANSPSGRKLNQSTNDFAKIVLNLENCILSNATHSTRIHEKAILEAFPTSFLGLMVDNPDSLDRRRGRRSDAYYQCLAADGSLKSSTLRKLIAHCLPDRCVRADLGGITNHDDRAALICALTALCVVAKDFVAVGDEDGRIILPPRSFIQDWAFAAMADNARELSIALHIERPILRKTRIQSKSSNQGLVRCPQ
jgi:hypothetical protein